MTERIVDERRDGSGWGSLWRLIAPYKLRVLVLSVVSLLSALLEAGFIVLITGLAMAMVDGASVVGPVLGQELSTSAALVAAAVALALRVALSLLGVWVSTTLTADVTTAQRRSLARAYLGASWELQHAEPSGRLQELLTSFVTRIAGAVGRLTAALTAGLSLFAFLGAGFVMDPRSTGAVLVALGGVSLALIPLRRAIRRRSKYEAAAGVAFANSVSELGSLGLEMQVFGAQRRFEEVVDALTVEASRTQRRTAVLQGAMPHVYISLTYGAVLAGVALLSRINVADFSVLGAILLLMLRSISYGQQLSTSIATLVAVQPFLDQVEATTAKYLASHGVTGDTRLPSVTPVAARDVGFGYTSERAALSHVSFRLEQGEALGVVGPSGAGKSTMAQLLLGLRQPTEGTLEFAGAQFSHLDHQWWTERVAFVPQDALLFTGTVADNIRFFRPGLDDAALREAAQRANVLRDIEALPLGFETHLGQRGSQLSGGQKQRLSIARALVGSPELLILDEPTSALDGRSEILIRDTLAQLKGDITIVIIAHRMSTLEICDRIMVVEDGRVSALDTPNSLANSSEFYRQARAIGVENRG